MREMTLNFGDMLVIGKEVDIIIQRLLPPFEWSQQIRFIIKAPRHITIKRTNNKQDQTPKV